MSLGSAQRLWVARHVPETVHAGLRGSSNSPCCGCEGSHIRQMARALGKKPTEERQWSVDYERPQSATEAYKKLRES